MEPLLLELLRHYGLHEIDGSASNPAIIEMGRSMGVDIEDDSTFAWCSLCLNYYAKKMGYERSGSLAARSWLKIPTEVSEPIMGDVVVFWRISKNSWQGHVALYISDNGDCHLSPLLRLITLS